MIIKIEKSQVLSIYKFNVRFSLNLGNGCLRIEDTQHSLFFININRVLISHSGNSDLYSQCESHFGCRSQVFFFSSLFTVTQGRPCETGLL